MAACLCPLVLLALHLLEGICKHHIVCYPYRAYDVRLVQAAAGMPTALVNALASRASVALLGSPSHICSIRHTSSSEAPVASFIISMIFLGIVASLVCALLAMVIFECKAAFLLLSSRDRGGRLACTARVSHLARTERLFIPCRQLTRSLVHR